MDSSDAAKANDWIVAEERVRARYRCPRCGMRSNDEAEAIACCEGLGPSASEKIAESRYDRSPK